MHLHKRFGVLQMHLSGSHFAQFPSQYGPSDYVQLSRYRCIFSSRKELFTLWYLGFGMQCLHPGNVFEIFTPTKIYRMKLRETQDNPPTSLAHITHVCNAYHIVERFFVCMTPFFWHFPRVWKCVAWLPQKPGTLTNARVWFSFHTMSCSGQPSDQNGTYESNGSI